MKKGKDKMDYSNLLERLVKCDEPIELLWQRLMELWNQCRLQSKDVEEYYDNGEEQTSELENFVFRTYRDVYSEIVCKCMQTQIYPHFLDELTAQVPTIFILDGMSVRELPLVLELSIENGYEAEKISFSYSAIPSNTLPFTKRLIGKEVSPKNIRGKVGDIKFAYVEKETDSFPSYKSPFLLWLAKPDVFFRSRTAVTLQSMIDETLGLFSRALKMYSLDHVLLTSDHGYIMDKHNWKLPKNSAFKGMERHTLLNELDKDGSKAFEKLQKEQIVISAGRFGLLVGRHQRRKGARKIGFHGGASLTELLIPQIALKKS